MKHLTLLVFFSSTLSAAITTQTFTGTLVQNGAPTRDGFLSAPIGGEASVTLTIDTSKFHQYFSTRGGASYWVYGGGVSLKVDHASGSVILQDTPGSSNSNMESNRFHTAIRGLRSYNNGVPDLAGLFQLTCPSNVSGLSNFTLDVFPLDAPPGCRFSMQVSGQGDTVVIELTPTSSAASPASDRQVAPISPDNSSLSSGEVTVRLITALDSATARGGQVTAGIVVRSSNPAAPVRSGAALQLTADPSGSFSIQLVRLSVNGQALRTASSRAVLASGVIGFIGNMARQPGQPQVAVSGARVFLPAHTDVQFTLTTPPNITMHSQAQQQGRVSPSTQTQASAQRLSATLPIWRIQAIKEGGHEAILTGVAESGGKRGPATLAVQCTVNVAGDTHEAYATLNYELRTLGGLIAFPVDSLGCQGDGAGNDFARIQVGTQPEKRGDFCYDGQLPDNPNTKVSMEIKPRDRKVAVTSPGSPLSIALRLPNSQNDTFLARFQLPQDGSSVEVLTSPCFKILDEADRREKAAQVVSCPELSNKSLRDVQVLVGTAMTKLKPDPENDIGVGWNLPKRTKAHPVIPKMTLACFYGITTPTPDPHEVLEKRLLPIPSTAAYCVFREDGHCSNSEGRN